MLKTKQTNIQEKHRIELIESRKNASLFWKTVKKFTYKNNQQNVNVNGLSI